jgi:hypothetical protein
MDKKNCNHKQKKEIIDNLFDKDKVVIDILPTLSNSSNTPSHLSTSTNLTKLPNISTLPNVPILPPIQSTKKSEDNSDIVKTLASQIQYQLPSQAPLLDAPNKPSNEKIEKNDNVEKPKEDPNNSLMINQAREQFQQLTLEEIHLNFKTLGRIKEHDKMYLRDFKFLEVDDSYIQMVSRTVKNAVWAGYNREDIIDFLLHLTEQTMKSCDVLTSTLKSNYEGRENTKNVLTNLLIDMEQSLIGLQKIKITYYNDNAILTRLDMIIDKFDKKIREVRDFLLKF